VRDQTGPPHHRFATTGDPAAFERLTELFVGHELVGEVRAIEGASAWS
jgi:hypothetical protein